MRDVVQTNQSILIDPRQRRIGQANTANTSQLLSTLSIFPFERRLGMSIEEIEVLVARARADAVNTNLRAYFPL